MAYQVVKDYYRREHFDFFRRYKYPFYNLTFELNIKAVYDFCKAREFSLNTNLAYLFTAALTELIDFRYRLYNGEIVLYEKLHFRMLVKHKEKNYTVARFNMVDDIFDFNRQAREITAQAHEKLDLSEEKSHKNFVYYSALPGVAFTSLTHVPEDDPADASPKVTFGQFKQQGGKLLVPVGMQVNHIFIEGQHIEQLVKLVQEKFDGV